MSDSLLTQLRDIIQDDIGRRGLRTDPERNLINACPDDFRLACHSLADHPQPALAVVTGFFIATSEPPAGETDGPLGALYLARALTPLGIRVLLVTDDYCVRALQAGLGECGLSERVPVLALPTPEQAKTMSQQAYWTCFADRADIATLTHLLSIERVGPNRNDRCHSMRGRDITDFTSPAHHLFEFANHEGKLTTLGIGDGGNEIGMGKIPSDIIDQNIPRGGLIACRIPTRHLIVSGVSNWGAYALAAGVHILRGRPMDPALLDPSVEMRLLEKMVVAGPLVDGVAGKPSVTVDGLTWEDYANVLVRIRALQASVFV